MEMAAVTSNYAAPQDVRKAGFQMFPQLITQLVLHMDAKLCKQGFEMNDTLSNAEPIFFRIESVVDLYYSQVRV